MKTNLVAVALVSAALAGCGASASSIVYQDALGNHRMATTVSDENLAHLEDCQLAKTRRGLEVATDHKGGRKCDRSAGNSVKHSFVAAIPGAAANIGGAMLMPGTNIGGAVAISEAVADAGVKVKIKK